MGDLNYASNSDKSKSRKPKPQIVSCDVKAQSETKMGKLKSIFIAEDVANVRDWVWNNAIVPNIKTGLCDLAGLVGDILTNSFCMMVTGTPARGIGPRNRASNGRINYNGCFVNPQTNQVEPRGQNDSVRTSRVPDTNFIFPTKNDAELVLQSMIADLQEYGTTTLDELYNVIGRTLPDNWQAGNVGWRSLADAYIQHVSGGWMLVMPRIERL